MALAEGLPVGKIQQLSKGRLIFPHQRFLKFVHELERAWVYNYTLHNHAYFGAELNKRIQLFIVSSDHFFQTLDRETRPLLQTNQAEDSQQSLFLRDVYSCILEKFLRTRHKDAAKSQNAHHDEHRRLESTAANVPLRTALKTTSANAASKANKAAPCDFEDSDSKEEI